MSLYLPAKFQVSIITVTSFRLQGVGGGGVGRVILPSTPTSKQTPEKPVQIRVNGRITLRQLIDLNIKWRYLNKMTPSLLVVWEISPFESVEFCFIHLQKQSGPSQASKLDFFARIVNSFELELPTIFATVSL